VNYIVKDDNPDVGFSVTVGGVTDAEGQPIPDAQVTVEVSSTDASVLAVTSNEDGKSGTVHFGDPGQASINVSAKSADGTVLATGSDGFTVTVGDPAAIASISTSFDGLTPVEPPPAG